jgi:hypothetical protein
MRNGISFNLFSLLRDPGAEGGGGLAATPAAPASAAPAPAAAPAAAPSSAPAAAHAAGAVAAPAGGAAPAAAPAAPAFKSALEGLPARGTAEYMKAFNDLPRERQQAIEAEVLDRDMHPQKYADLDKQKPAAGDPAVGPDGQPVAVELGWTEEAFAALDPHTQASVKAMQEVIDQVAPYVQDGKLKDGMQVLVNDPVVKARMAQLAKGEDPYAVPDELVDAFDPSSYITKEDLAQIDLQMKPVESRALLSGALQKAFEDGAKNAAMRGEYEKNSAVAMVRRQGLFQTQLGSLMNSNPSLKSDKPFSDAAHPLHEYVKWAGDNLGDDFLEQHGQEVGYATYLAAKGKLKETMQNVVKTQQLSFIRAVENGDKKVAMMGRGGPATPPVSADPALGGVDAAKYLADPQYRRNAFANAKPEVRRKLEVLSATGKF